MSARAATRQAKGLAPKPTLEIPETVRAHYEETFAAWHAKIGGPEDAARSLFAIGVISRGLAALEREIRR